MAAVYTGFQRIIEAYTSALRGGTWTPKTAPAGARMAGQALTTLAAEGQQFGAWAITDADFTMTNERGVATGRIVVATRPGEPLYLDIGDYVVFRPEEGIEWARLIVVRQAPGEYSQTYYLEGESLGLTQTPATELETATENDNLFVAQTSYQIMSAILNGNAELDDWDWQAHRDFANSAGPAPGRFQTDPATTVANVLQDLGEFWRGHAASNPNGRPVVWGVCSGYGRDGVPHFYFHPLWDPTAVVIEYSHGLKSAATRLYKCEWSDPYWAMSDPAEAHVLNMPDENTGQFYNVLDFVGGPAHGGEGNIKVTYRADRSPFNLERVGGLIRSARREVSTIRTLDDAEQYARGFFQRWAAPTLGFDEIEIVIPGADYLPLPWAGYCRVRSARAVHDGAILPIRNVTISFGEQPIARVLVGETERTNPFASRGGDPFAPGVPFGEAMRKLRRVPVSGSAGVAEVNTLPRHSHSGIADGGWRTGWMG
jgi:hypothetical protein